MYKFIQNKGIIICLLVGTFLLFFKLSEYPKGFHIDEVRVGNTAWSILKTGNDFYGNKLPIYFNSFGDWRPMGLMYVTVPFVSILGLNETSVRLPSAIFALINILLTYFLVITVCKNKNLAVVTALLMTTCPWLIILGRSTSESMPALTFSLLAIMFWFKAYESNKFNHIKWGTAATIISFLFYHSPRIFMPLLLFYFLPLSWFNAKKLLFKTYLINWMIIVVSVGVMIFVIPGGSGRIQQTSLFSSSDIKTKINSLIQDEGQNNTIIARIFHNKIGVTMGQLTQNYVNYFSPDFLFFKGGQPQRYTVSDTGLISITLLPFFILGLLSLLNNYKKLSLIIWWLIISPIPAAMTADYQPNVQRSIFLLPVLIIICSLGIEKIIQIKFIKLKYLIIGSFVFLYLITGIYFSHQYTSHMTGIQKNERDLNLTLMAKKISDYSQYNRIYISTIPIPSYEHLFFYQGFDPVLLQTKGDIRNLDIWNYNKYYFVQDRCPSIVVNDQEPNYLYIDSAICKLNQNTKEVDTIKDNEVDIYYRSRITVK